MAALVLTWYSASLSLSAWDKTFWIYPLITNKYVELNWQRMQRTKELSLTAASRANHSQAHELRNNNLDTKTCMKRVFLTCFQFETWHPLCHSNESHLNSDENITHTSLHVICLSHPYFPILAVFFCGWITADVWAKTTTRTEAAHPW